MEKKCTFCKKIKNVENFNKNKSKNDGYSNVCKICSRLKSKNYYENNKEQQIKNISINKKNRIKENRKKLYQYYILNPCVDCNENDPIVLESDHRENKKMEISKLVSLGYSWEIIYEELKKCDTRCANCHRRKTAKDYNWYNCVVH